MTNPVSSRTIELPIVALANFQEYNKQKKDRIDAQKKRKQLEETVAYLKRNAVETNKKFNQTQLDLWKVYKKKANHYEAYQQKNKYHENAEKTIEERRNMSSLSRYLHQVKKQQAFNDLLKKKKKIAQAIKKNRKQIQQEKKTNDSRIVEAQKEKNKLLNDSVKRATFYARSKAFNEKIKASKNVRSEMISLEQGVRDRQLERILDLEKKKEQLSQIVKKTKKNKDKMQNIRAEVDSMEANEVYSIVQPQENDTISIKTLSRTFRKSRQMRKKNIV